MITLTVNGQPQTLEAGASVAQLLQKMALSNRRLAVERNGEIVPRSRFEEVELATGDIVEIVMAVGGG
ncbi:MAG: sulfur carrier protein ThiS [Betaproteobacteria bacterium]|nr:sulfur carrier protein ThiS [Betaproteobacteria bacterium]